MVTEVINRKSPELVTLLKVFTDLALDTGTGHSMLATWQTHPCSTEATPPYPETAPQLTTPNHTASAEIELSPTVQAVGASSRGHLSTTP